MGILVKKKAFQGADCKIVVGLWVGSDGLRVTISEDDACGLGADDLDLDDALTVARLIRSLKKWSETPEGECKVREKYNKEVELLSR